MPMLRFRGIEKEELLVKSTTLLDQLELLVGCPRDYFTLELLKSNYIFDGNLISQPTFIEVHWFDRGQEVQDKVAKALTSLFQEDRDFLEIYFTNLKENNYYENGTHY